MVKNLPAMQEAQVLSLGQEDPLEEAMVTHSSILAWEITRTEEPGGHRDSNTTEVIKHTHMIHVCIAFIIWLYSSFNQFFIDLVNIYVLWGFCCCCFIKKWYGMDGATHTHVSISKRLSLNSRNGIARLQGTYMHFTFGLLV